MHFEAFREFVDETGSEMSLEAFEQWHNEQVLVKESSNAAGPVTWDTGSEDIDDFEKEIVPDVLVDAPEDADIVLKNDSESKQSFKIVTPPEEVIENIEDDSGTKEKRQEAI